MVTPSSRNAFLSQKIQLILANPELPSSDANSKWNGVDLIELRSLTTSARDVTILVEVKHTRMAVSESDQHTELGRDYSLQLKDIERSSHL